MTTLGVEDEHYGYKFCWFGASLMTLLSHDGLNTSKIHTLSKKT